MLCATFYFDDHVLLSLYVLLLVHVTTTTFPAYFRFGFRFRFFYFLVFHLPLSNCGWLGHFPAQKLRLYFTAGFLNSSVQDTWFINTRNMQVLLQSMHCSCSSPQLNYLGKSPVLAPNSSRKFRTASWHKILG